MTQRRSLEGRPETPALKAPRVRRVTSSRPGWLLDLSSALLPGSSSALPDPADLFELCPWLLSSSGFPGDISGQDVGDGVTTLSPCTGTLATSWLSRKAPLWPSLGRPQP